MLPSEVIITTVCFMSKFLMHCCFKCCIIVEAYIANASSEILNK